MKFNIKLNHFKKQYIAIHTYSKYAFKYHRQFTSSQVKHLSKWTPFWYSCNGGSTKITSNSQPIRSKRGNSVLFGFESFDFRYIGFCGTFVFAMRSSFSLINSLSFGYSSKRSFRPGSRMKFCGLWPISTKYWL